MTVYADVLMIVNLYVDFFLLYGVRRFLGLRTRTRRLLLGAFVGAAASLAALLPGQGGWMQAVISVAAAIAVTLAAFAPLPPRTLLRAGLCFFAFSLLLAGFFLMLLRVFHPRNLQVLGGVVYIDLSLPMLFGFTCGAYLLLALLRRLLPAPEGGACRWLTVELNGKTARVFAKEDTGNALREPFSGLPVVVCQQDCLCGLLNLPPDAPAEALLNREPPLPGLRMVPFTSLGGGGVLPAFRPDRVTAGEGEILSDCYIALCDRQLSAGQYNALYDPTMNLGGKQHEVSVH